MPVILGDVGIKSWSYEILVTSSGTEVCEDCLRKIGDDPEDPDYIPIFASTEMDRNPVCDACGYTSFVFSPTYECVADWVESLTDYIVRREGNTDFLDRVSEHMFFVTDDDGENKVAEIYDAVRKYENGG